MVHLTIVVATVAGIALVAGVGHASPTVTKPSEAAAVPAPAPAMHPYVGRLQLGQQKEPFSIEELESDAFTTFMERSVANSLGPERQIGARVLNAVANQRFAYSFGAFVRTPNGRTAVFNNNVDLVARLTGLPWDHGRSGLSRGS